MEFTFKLLSNNIQAFFEILPQDWQDEVVPFWNDFRTNSNVYVIEENNAVIGGGIIFSKPLPALAYFEEAQKWFDKGFGYIGFLWIAEHKRNNNLGSFWLEELKKQNPQQNYWLLIEEERLHRFYQRNGFSLYKQIVNDDHPEWLYVFDSQSL